MLLARLACASLTQKCGSVKDDKQLISDSPVVRVRDPSAAAERAAMRARVLGRLIIINAQYTSNYRAAKSSTRFPPRL